MYALLGSGRVARHFAFYLNSLDLPLRQWSRNGNPFFNSAGELDASERLRKTVLDASHVLLAVSDAAVSSLAGQVRAIDERKILVHFSGALNLPGVAGAHPLMTFIDRLESLDWYRGIPFAIDLGEEFSRLLPGLPNVHYSIPPASRPLYHALCSLAGNSTFMLWQKIGDQFESRLGLPRELLRPFLHQVVTNSSLSGEKNFTGPVARGDWQVVRGHLASLEAQPELRDAYKHYLRLAASAGFALPEGLL